MKTQHTKGEWLISPIHPNQIKGNAGTGEIATVSENRIGEWEANAKLIAAAPELLMSLIDFHKQAMAELKKTCKYCEGTGSINHNGSNYQCAHNVSDFAVLAAIEKATK